MINMKTNQYSSKELLRFAFSYMKSYVLYYIVALLLVFLSVCGDLLIPFLLGKVLKELGNDVINFNNIINYVFIGVIAVSITSISNYIESLILHKIGLKIVYKMRYDVFDHIQSLSMEQFNQIPNGTLVTRVTNDINVLFNLYTNMLISIIRNIVTIISVFITMFMLNIKLTLMLLLSVPVLFIVSFIFRYFSRKTHRKVRNSVSSLNAFLSENISGVKITQIFNQEDKVFNEFKDRNYELKKNSLNEIFIFGLFRPFIMFIYVITVIIVIYFGGKEAINLNNGVITQAITYDVLFSFYLYISNFFNPIQTLANEFNELQSAISSSEKIYGIMMVKPTIVDSSDAIDINITGDIEFRDVWFSYVPGELVLKGVSFHVHKNEKIAFVGATGSGKSTILSLITRNYDIQKGEILIDGIDVKKIKLDCLRRQFGQMLQDVFLFSGSVYSNIVLGDESITLKEVEDTCDYINAKKFIDKLPNKLNEEVRERGNNFSLGERQLISFARTLVHKPNVLILDEATSNIDTESEVLIQDALDKIMKSGTILIVAHRLSTIQHCDKIYVFSQGNIIESGNHQELLKKKGKYYKLYKLQFSERIE